MEQIERYKCLIRFGAAAVILFVEIGLYHLLWTHCYNRAIAMPFRRRGNWFMTDLYGTVFFAFHDLYDGLKVSFFRKSNTIYSQFLAIPATNIFGYLLLVLMERHWYMPLPFMILTTVDMVLVFFWAGIFQWTYSLLFPPRQLLLIYGKRSVAHVLGKMSSRDDKYVLTATIRIDEDIEHTMQEMPKYSDVIIGDLGSHDRNLIFKRCYETDKRVYVIPKISNVLIQSSDKLELFDIMLLLPRNDGLQVDQLFYKRVLDILSMGALLILSLSLFLLSTITIRLGDKGPVFYKQCRLTKDGRTFDILRLCTMWVNAETDDVAHPATQADDQITRVGKVLRAARLDELPRMLNILKDDMSMVGPHPEHPEIAAEYKGEIPEFDHRLKVKAGPAGYAQTCGVYNTTPHDKLELDLIYIRSYLIFLDLKLVFMTPKILFMGGKTKDVADGQVTAAQQTGDLNDELKF